ncbi:MAG: ABC transporter permease, partial [Phycisphaeraceae bacterium]|nr:ABC transporter permease [Phycisphaeraceae bacterium]
NPIIRRELLTMLREPRTLAFQLAFIGALSALVILRWPTAGFVDLGGTQALQVIRIFGYGMLVAMILLAPVFPATSFVRERQQGTLILLLMSPMSRVKILAGKLVGVIGFLLLMMALSLPAAAACFSMGGVGLGQIIVMYAILLAVALQYATMGLLISTYASTTDAALRIAYGLVLLLAVASLGPHQFLQGKFAGMPAMALEWIRCLSPLPAMMELLGQAGIAERGTLGMAGAAGRFLILAALTTIGFIVWTGARLNQRMFDRARAQGTMTEDRSRGQRIWRRLMFLYDPQRRSKLIGGLMNPVLVKEFRTRKFGRTHWILRLFAICLVLSLMLQLATTRGSMEWGVATLGAIVVLLQMALIVLLTPSLASGLISGEVETGGWQLLQMTGLNSFRIVLGKLASVIWTLLLVLLATVPACVVLVLIDESQAQRLTDLVISLLITAVWALLLSAAVSSCFRRTAAATATVYTLLVLQCAGTMLFWLGRDKTGESEVLSAAVAGSESAPWFAHSTIETVLTVNPVAGALKVMGAPGFENFDLVPANWWILGIGSVVCLMVLSVRVWLLSKPQ